MEPIIKWGIWHKSSRRFCTAGAITPCFFDTKEEALKWGRGLFDKKDILITCIGLMEIE